MLLLIFMLVLMEMPMLVLLRIFIIMQRESMHILTYLLVLSFVVIVI